MTWRGIEGKAHTLAEFEARLAKLNFSTFQFKPSFCVLHNTGIPTFKAWHSVPGEKRMAALERYYRDEKGWSAGPHLFIADDLIWTFTPLWLQGTHAPSWNPVAWGAEMVGDYDSEALNRGVYANMIGALTAMHRLGGMSPTTLRLHKEDPQTKHYGCPGKNVDKANVIASIRAHLSGTSSEFDDVDVGGSTTAAPSLASPVLARGSKDRFAVIELQKLLGLKVNAPGVFGPITENEVIAFQKAHGLDADGIVGRDTWLLLRSTTR